MKKKMRKRGKSTPDKRVLPYRITYEPFDKYSGEDQKKINDLFDEYAESCRRSPKTAIRKIRRSIKRYPQVSEFYGYLGIASEKPCPAYIFRTASPKI